MVERFIPRVFGAADCDVRRGGWGRRGESAGCGGGGGGGASRLAPRKGSLPLAVARDVHLGTRFGA